jgi:hypothetical protein
MFNPIQAQGEALARRAKEGVKYVVRAAGPGKGLGVFATERILRGTRILSERAVLSISPSSPSSLGSSHRGAEVPLSLSQGTAPSNPASTTSRKTRSSTAQQLLHAFQKLKERDKQAVLALSRYPGTGITLLGRWISALTNALSMSSRGHVFENAKLNKSVLDIFRSNSFLVCAPVFRRRTPPRDGDEIGAGDPQSQTPALMSLFPSIARLNHMCVPNAQANLHPLTSRLNVHALRDIPPGEEICISYLDETGLLGREERAQALAGWGFACACSACEGVGEEGEGAVRGGNAAEAMENRRVALRQRIRGFALSAGGTVSGDTDGEEMGGYAPDGSTDVWDPPAPLAQDTAPGNEGGSQIKTEISLMTALVAHLTDSGVSGHGLASLYYRLARLYLAEADASVEAESDAPGRVLLQEKALVCAQRGLDIDRSCLGEDHPAFLDALRWVEEEIPARERDSNGGGTR